jgi:DNA-binding transcriptional ArsR family regulator
MANVTVATVMRALADPTRRAIFERIVNAEDITVVELTRDSGISQSATSQHLRSLKQSGLIRARRRGRNTHYRAQAEGLGPLVDWLSVYGLFWRDRFDRLKKLLKEIDR